MKPLALMIELYAGLHGWGVGGVAQGFRVVGFDILDVCALLGKERPQGCHLVIQDVLTLHGSQLKNAAVIVASPPCQEYSYMAMPWKRAKAQVPDVLPDWWKKPESKMTKKEYREWWDWRTEHPAKPPSTELFDACFRIQREASEAAGRYIPLIVENVRGAQPWVGRAKANFGSYYLWGDVGMVGKRVVAGVPRFGVSVQPMGRELKQPGRNFHFPEKYGIPSPSFHGHASEPSVVAATGIKNEGGSWFAVAHNTNPVNGSKVPGISFNGYGTPDYKPQGFNVTAAQRYREGTKQSGISGERNNGKGDKWFQDGAARHGSKSNSRKAASAQIAQIPYPLARYIASCFWAIEEVSA